MKTNNSNIINTILILVSLCFTQVVATPGIHATLRPNRSALGIVKGDSSSAPSPAPSHSQSSPPPPSTNGQARVEEATKVVQQFVQGIDSDNCDLSKLKDIRNPNLCSNPKFGCAPLPSTKEDALYSFQFNGCNITGKGKPVSLDNFINKLHEVSIFHANSNGFGGEIPDLSHLPYLYEFDISNNKFTGKFPINVLGAKKLTFLDLRYNQFVGPLPPGVFDLELLVLFLNNNMFDGELPSNMGSTLAAFVTFANNKFTGPIPKSIGQASDTLLEILFLNNSFSGCLPHEIGLLKKARVFDVSSNKLTGPIPMSFACLGAMEHLVMDKNEFYGPVPEEVCMLPRLRTLSLGNNYFTQVGPECRKLIRKGVLNVTQNCILGQPDQRSPSECVSFSKKPKTCGGNNMLDYIPCKDTAGYLNGEPLAPQPEPSPVLSYSAIAGES